jgi:hypothetical protein
MNDDRGLSVLVAVVVWQVVTFWLYFGRFVNGPDVERRNPEWLLAVGSCGHGRKEIGGKVIEASLWASDTVDSINTDEEHRQWGSEFQWQDTDFCFSVSK